MHRQSAPPPCLLLRSSLDEPAIQAILSMQNQNKSRGWIPVPNHKLSDDTDSSVRSARRGPDTLSCRRGRWLRAADCASEDYVTVADVRWEMPARFAATWSPGWKREGRGSTDRSLSVCSSFYAEFLNLDARANPPNPCPRHRSCHDVLSRHGARCTPLPIWSDGPPGFPQQETLNRLPAHPSAQGHPEKHAESACARPCLKPRLAVDRGLRQSSSSLTLQSRCRSWVVFDLPQI